VGSGQVKIHNKKEQKNKNPRKVSGSPIKGKTLARKTDHRRKKGTEKKRGSQHRSGSGANETPVNAWPKSQFFGVLCPQNPPHKRDKKKWRGPTRAKAKECVGKPAEIATQSAV